MLSKKVLEKVVLITKRTFEFSDYTLTFDPKPAYYAAVFAGHFCVWTLCIIAVSWYQYIQ